MDEPHPFVIRGNDGSESLSSFGVEFMHVMAGAGVEITPKEVIEGIKGFKHGKCARCKKNGRITWTLCRKCYYKIAKGES